MIYRKLKRTWSHNDLNYIPRFRETFPELKKVSSEELAALKQVVDKTDFLKYSFDSNAFCQSYADGQDLVLTFPGRYEDQSFRPCSLAIPSDDTSIQYIKDFITNHSKD